MNKERKFFDAEFEIDLLKYQLSTQNIKNWLFVIFMIVLSVGLYIERGNILDLRDSAAIMQCEKDAQKVGASFAFVDGECSILYSE